jgi:NADPH:quinone reductase-like Zn-dependent oxidoreductase
MKAAVLHEYDRPPIYDDFPDPTPTDDELLVHVAAAALHPVVKALGAGQHYSSKDGLPFVPGIDGTGRLDDGTSVFFGGPRPPYGTFSELTVVPRAACIQLPDGVDEVKVAAIMNPGLSSWGALKLRARLVAGESVLILGATGVAGGLAVQVAKLLGAGRVIAAGRDAQRLKRLIELGADEMIGLDARELVKYPVDVVLDYLWGPPVEAFLETRVKVGLKDSWRRVRFVQIGQSAGPRLTLAAETLRSSGLELVGSGLGSAPMQDVIATIPEFLEQVVRGNLTVGLAIRPLAQVESVWTEEQPGNRIVLTP